MDLNTYRMRPALLTQAPGDLAPAHPDRKPLVDGHRLLTIAAIEPEAELVTSFWLAALDGAGLPEPVAGQFLPIAVDVPGHGILRRTYTISGYEAGRYRLSIKRERLLGQLEGRVSNYVHDHWAVGDRVSAGAPQGGFVLDAESRRPILMLAGGIGITPLLSMLRELAARDPNRRVVLIVGVRHQRDHPFRHEIGELGRKMPNLTIHVRYSERIEGGPDPKTADSFGFVDEALLRTLLPGQDTDVYLCGPAPFMNAMDRAIAALGVPDARVRFEAFGPATIERRRQPTSVKEPMGAPLVTFAQSGVSAPFDPRALNLLEFAEDLGISPPFSCRSGSCGSCATRKLAGTVRYMQEPTAQVGTGEVLLCCAVPDGAVSLDA